MGINKLILCLGILGAGDLWARKSCEGALYRVADIQASKTRAHEFSRARHRLYVRWAAKAANFASHEIGPTQLLRVFLEIAKGRRDLARDQGLKYFERFGSLRWEEEGADVDHWISTSFSYSKNPKKQKNNLRVRAFIEGMLNSTSLEEVFIGEDLPTRTTKSLILHWGARAWVVANSYDSPRLRISELTKLYVVKWGEDLLETEYLHPAPKVAKRIFFDALFESQVFLRTKRRRNFCKAVYGYYNACPLRRGSASVGHAFFRGLYYSALGEPLPFSPEEVDLDHLALGARDFQEFESRCEGLFGTGNG